MVFGKVAVNAQISDSFTKHINIIFIIFSSSTRGISLRNLKPALLFLGFRA